MLRHHVATQAIAQIRAHEAKVALPQRGGNLAATGPDSRPGEFGPAPMHFALQST
jgi:hypothetical protein